MNFFSFNSSTHDLWQIYEDLKKYYPIGIRYSELGIYGEYYGQKQLRGLILNAFHSQDTSKNNWQNLLSEVETISGEKVIGTTLGQEPSYSGFVMVSSKRNGSFLHQKKTSFFYKLNKELLPGVW